MNSNKVWVDAIQLQKSNLSTKLLYEFTIEEEEEIPTRQGLHGCRGICNLTRIGQYNHT